jgi:general secretion pathway protein I
MMSIRDGGFTLMEALVALLLLALAAGAFYQGIELGARGARIAQRDAAAIGVAQNRLEEAIAIGQRADAQWSGETDNGIAWQTTFTPHKATSRDGGQEPLSLTRIDVRVTWRDVPGRPVRDVTLTTFALAKPP